MNLSSHIAHLRQKHETLERKIEEENRRPAADDLEVAALKRQKLHIKEEITRLGGAD